MKHLIEDTSSEEDIDEESLDLEEPLPKKHKKHKHKKHRKKKSENSPKKNKSSPELGFQNSKEGMQTQKASASALKLMIKYNEREEQENTKQKKVEVAESSVQKYVDRIGKELNLVQTSPGSSGALKNSGKKKKGQRKDSETSSEEERWLDAIQSGKLEEVDEELKKIKPKDPKLMTARQRAMFERKTDKDSGEQLMSLPLGYKEVVMTDEDLQRKAIKSQKRKQLADEKREKDKKKTMERLLKKQDSKTIKCGSRKLSKKTTAQISYRITNTISFISFPVGVDLPLLSGNSNKNSDIKTPVKCSLSGCNNIKKYNCSKTGVPLCSLSCYKQNLSINQ